MTLNDDSEEEACEFSREPVDNYDGERNDRYEEVCLTHHVSSDVCHAHTGRGTDQ